MGGRTDGRRFDLSPAGRADPEGMDDPMINLLFQSITASISENLLSPPPQDGRTDRFEACLGWLAVFCVIGALQRTRWAFAAHPASMVSSPESARAAQVRRVLIIGSGTVGQSLARGIQAEGRGRVVGFVDDDCESGVVAGEWPLLGSRNEVIRLVREFEVDDVMVAYAPTWQQRLVNELSVECPNTEVEIVPTPYEAMIRTTRMRSFDDIALIRLSLGVGGLEDTVKRLLDILLSLGGLIVLSPLLALTALLIRVTSRGPVLFVQERVGRGGEPFTLYKLRTMVYDAERETGPVLAEEDDPRLTGIGRWLKRFRLDEFPQLWNVLVGEMSLVGPRPERPCFVERFTRQTPAYARRHEVRPGITGLAQVCGGYHTDARDKLRFDLIYVSHRSLWLDLVILIRTAGALHRHR